MELRCHRTLSSSLSMWRSSTVATTHGQHVIPVVDMGLVCVCVCVCVSVCISLLLNLTCKPGVHRFSEKYRSHLRILGSRNVTRSNFYAEDSHILGATVHNLVARTFWHPKFVYPCFKHLVQHPGRGDRPVAKPSCAEENTKRAYEDVLQWFLWSSKSPSVCWSGRRRYTPCTRTAQPL